MKKNNKKIYWIRHGESFSNTSDLNHNIIDPYLTKHGIEQCEILKNKIKSDNLYEKIDLVVVSPLSRSLQTCSNVFDNLIYQVNFICMEEVREHINQPCHKRKTKLELKNKYKFIDFSNLIYEDDYLYMKYNGNESKSEIIIRCNKFIKWLKSRKEKNIVVVSHGNFLFPMFNDVLKDIPNKSFFTNCELRIYEL
jgi:broad specificity phosphatase PhoE